MDNAKAKEAVDKAVQHQQLAALMAEQEKAQQPDLQPADGYINPYGRMGTVPPTTYSIPNQLNGTNTQSVVDTWT